MITFEVNHHAYGEFSFKGQLKGIPGYARNFELTLRDLEMAREENKDTYEVENSGVTFSIKFTIPFLKKKFKI